MVARQIPPSNLSFICRISLTLIFYFYLNIEAIDRFLVKGIKSEESLP